MRPDFSLPPPLPCVHDCVHESECVLASLWETPQRRAGLYRLATPVHRGQPASNRKCVYKWGSYFYCFHHFTRSTISLTLSPSTSPSLFSGTSSYFSSLRCLPPAFAHWSLKVQQKLAFRSSSPPQPGFQGFRSPSGILLPWFPRRRTLCPRDSSWPPQKHNFEPNFPQSSSFVLMGLPCDLLSSKRVQEKEKWFGLLEIMPHSSLSAHITLSNGCLHRFEFKWNLRCSC